MSRRADDVSNNGVEITPLKNRYGDDEDGNATEANSSDHPLVAAIHDKQTNGKLDGSTNTKLSLKAMWRLVKTDVTYRHKFVHTALVCWSFVGLGWRIGMVGSTFPDLRQIIHEDLARSSFMFTAGSIGYTTGSLVGGILYDRYNKLILLALSTLGMALTTIFTPYCTTLPIMLAVQGLGAVFCGGLDTGGNADIIFVWGSQGASYMQALHFGFSLGALLSPLATEPFLAKKFATCINNTDTISSSWNVSDRPVFTSDFLNSTVNSASWSNIRYPSTASKLNIGVSSTVPSLQNDSLPSNMSYGNFSEICTDMYEETHVHAAFLLAGIIILTSTVGYIYLYCKLRHVHENLTLAANGNAASDQDSKKRPKLTTKSKILFLILMCLLIGTWCIVEDSFVNFLMTFALIYLKFDKTEGAYASAVYWISFGVGRFTGIFVVNLCKQSVLLTSATLVIVCTYIGFAICSYLTIVPLIWVLIGVLGFSMSVMFPIIFSWASDNIVLISGKVAAMMFVSCSLGGISFPLLLGHLMEYYNPLWFVYLIGIVLLVFLCVYITVRVSLKAYVGNQKLSKDRVKQ